MNSSQLPQLNIPSSKKQKTLEYGASNQNILFSKSKQSRMEPLSQSVIHRRESISKQLQQKNINWRNNKFEELMAFTFETDKHKRKSNNFNLKQRVKSKDVTVDNKKKVKFSLPNVSN